MVGDTRRKFNQNRGKPVVFSKEEEKAKAASSTDEQDKGIRTIIEQLGSRENSAHPRVAHHRCERSTRIRLLPRVIHQSNVENNGQIPFALAASSYLEYAIITSLRISGSFHLYPWVDDNPRVHACTDSFPVSRLSSARSFFPLDTSINRYASASIRPVLVASPRRLAAISKRRRAQASPGIRLHDNLSPYIMYATLQFASGSTCTYRISLE